MLLVLLTLPVTLADNDYEENRAEFAGLAEVGFVLITIWSIILLNNEEDAIHRVQKRKN